MEPRLGQLGNDSSCTWQVTSLTCESSYLLCAVEGLELRYEARGSVEAWKFMLWRGSVMSLRFACLVAFTRNCAKKIHMKDVVLCSSAWFDSLCFIVVFFYFMFMFMFMFMFIFYFFFFVF